MGGIEGSVSFVMLVLGEGSVADCMLGEMERSVRGIEGSVAFGTLGEFEGSVGLTMLGEVRGSMSVAMQFTLVLVAFDLQRNLFLDNTRSSFDTVIVGKPLFALILFTKVT